MTHPNLLGAAALLVGGCALFFSLQGPAPVPPRGDAALRARLVRLEDRVDALPAGAHRAEPIDAEHALAPRRNVAPARRTLVGGDLHERLDALEERLAAIESGGGSGGMLTVARLEQLLEQLDEVRRERREREREQQRTEMRARFLEPSLPLAERLDALRRLRRLGDGARAGAVAQTAIAIARTSLDPDTRAAVWRYMDGSDAPALAPHLIVSLQMDADPDVREEAADTLSSFRDRPDVRAALEAALQDPDEAVRREAAQALGRRRGG